MKLSILMPAYN
jgi:dolichol-phosphate hexosyltransferase